MKFAVLYSCILTAGLALSAQNVHAFSSAKHPELEVVEKVDLERYAGKWYQIAYLPTRFQKNCEINTTAEYTPRKDGKVQVVNECTSRSGKRKSITGTARVVDEQTNAKLKVKFFWFAPAGAYWIIDLDQNYDYAVVGSPNRKFLWILSREPSISRSLYEGLVARAAQKGFDPARIKLTSALKE